MKYNTPSRKLNYDIDIESKKDYSRVFLKENSMPVDVTSYGFCDGKSIYISASKFYYKNHFVKVEAINDSLLFGFDKVYDPNQANQGGMYGGGLQGYAIAKATATRKIPFFININDGTMSAFTSTTMNYSILKDYSSLKRHYKTLKINEHNPKIKEFFLHLLKKGIL